MSKVEIIHNSDGQYQLTGSLDQSTVGQVWQERTIFKTIDIKPVIDLAGITQSDSAGLALLVCLQSEAIQSQQHISYINIPEQLRQLIELNRLEDVLSCSQHL